MLGLPRRRLSKGSAITDDVSVYSLSLESGKGTFRFLYSVQVERAILRRSHSADGSDVTGSGTATGCGVTICQFPKIYADWMAMRRGRTLTEMLPSLRGETSSSSPATVHDLAASKKGQQQMPRKKFSTVSRGSLQPPRKREELGLKFRVLKPAKEKPRKSTQDVRHSKEGQPGNYNASTKVPKLPIIFELTAAKTPGSGTSRPGSSVL